MTLIELLRKRAELLAQAQTIHNAAEVLSDEQRTQFDALMKQVEELDTAIARARQLETAGEAEAVNGSVVRAQPQQAGPTGAPAQHRRRTPDTEEGIYCRFIRTGDEAAMRELREQRASNNTDMNVGTAADGGDLVPTGHYNQIIERLRPQSLPDRLGVMRIPGAGLTVYVPIDNETDDGAFVSTAESVEFDRDAPAVSKVTMTLAKYTKKVDLTYELLQGEDAGLMAFLSRYVADGMAATLNKLLVTEVLANGTAGLTLAGATAITAAEVTNLQYKLKARYAAGPNVSWLMRRSVEGYIRGLTGNQFLFAPTPNGTPGNGLLGLDANTDDNMGAQSASGKSLLIGNWAYMGMRLDPTLQVLRNPYIRADYGEIRLNYYFMAVFKVLQAEAFQYATQASA